MVAALLQKATPNEVAFDIHLEFAIFTAPVFCAADSRLKRAVFTIDSRLLFRRTFINRQIGINIFVFRIAVLNNRIH